jgi:hypothetical protein
MGVLCVVKGFVRRVCTNTLFIIIITRLPITYISNERINIILSIFLSLK